MPQTTGPWFNIKMLSYQYRKSHCGDKTVVRSSYLHNGISYTGKMSSLYWIGAQGIIQPKCWYNRQTLQCNLIKSTNIHPMQVSSDRLVISHAWLWLLKVTQNFAAKVCLARTPVQISWCCDTFNIQFRSFEISYDKSTIWFETQLLTKTGLSCVPDVLCGVDLGSLLWCDGNTRYPWGKC